MINNFHIVIAIINCEFQVGKSQISLQPCCGENGYLCCFFKTEKTKYFVNQISGNMSAMKILGLQIMKEIGEFCVKISLILYYKKVRVLETKKSLQILSLKKSDLILFIYFFILKKIIQFSFLAGT